MNLAQAVEGVQDAPASELSVHSCAIGRKFMTLRLRAIYNIVLFGRLVRPVYALNAASIRQTENLLYAYFRIHLTMDALALC